MTTSRIVVACPSCGQEVNLTITRVDTQVDEQIRVAHSESPIAILLRADVVAAGRHSCTTG